MTDKAGKLPPTPELDKAIEHKETVTTIMSFLEHLTFEKELLLATWQPCSVEYHGNYEAFIECNVLHHLVPDRSPIYNLVLEYFGIDKNTMETERLTLLNHHRLTT